MSRGRSARSASGVAAFAAFGDFPVGVARLNVPLNDLLAASGVAAVARFGVEGPEVATGFFVRPTRGEDASGLRGEAATGVGIRDFARVSARAPRHFVQFLITVY